jgi:hypothetical protein
MKLQYLGDARDAFKWDLMLLRLTPVGLVETMWAWADRSIRRTCGTSADASPHRRPASNT